MRPGAGDDSPCACLHNAARGHRIESLETASQIRVTADAQQIEPKLVSLAIGVPTLVLWLLWVRDFLFLLRMMIDIDRNMTCLWYQVLKNGVNS